MTYTLMLFLSGILKTFFFLFYFSLNHYYKGFTESQLNFRQKASKRSAVQMMAQLEEIER